MTNPRSRTQCLVQILFGDGRLPHLPMAYLFAVRRDGTLPWSEFPRVGTWSGSWPRHGNAVGKFDSERAVRFVARFKRSHRPDQGTSCDRKSSYLDVGERPLHPSDAAVERAHVCMRPWASHGPLCAPLGRGERLRYWWVSGPNFALSRYGATSQIALDNC